MYPFGASQEFTPQPKENIKLSIYQQWLRGKTNQRGKDKNNNTKKGERTKEIS